MSRQAFWQKKQWGRRLWVRGQRLSRWEFWPMAVVYTPIAFYWVWLAARFGDWGIWLNCNPVLPASGMAMESKGGILDRFEGPDGAVKVARYLRVPDDGRDRLAEILEAGFSFPMVLKPDLGQRGAGVEIVANEGAARQWLEKCRDEDSVVQEFADGLEFGVHWSRGPREEVGQILSLCQKHKQSVTGDGKRTLEELVLNDDRAALMVSYYEVAFAKRWQAVIGDGEVVEVAPIGTHSRGAVFTDDRSLVTPELVAVFDELGARFKGFCFGRYDVKVPSVADLQAGKNIVVLELNPVMGEPTHVYQPGYAWWQGMRDFFAHFRRAAEIGAAWRAQGVAPPSLHEVWELAMAHRERDFLEVAKDEN